MLKFLYEKFSLASPTPPVKILAKISSFAIIFLFLFSNGFCIILRDSLNINQINTKINPICSLDGCGWNDDYFPKGATNESIMFRANEKMILQTNIDNIEEFANFQSRNQICFTTIRTEENGFVVINIPFELCDGLKVYEFDLLETLNITELNFSFEEINQNKFLKIDFSGKDVKTKVVLDYTNSQSLKQYLINNPFEFNVVEGESATFKNFIKTNSHKYSVEIETEKPVTIEIPTFFYKGYKVTFKTANSEIELPATHGANGFIELQIAESGTLFVEFEGKYVTAANIISLIGIFVSVGLVVTIFIKDKKTQKFIKNPEKIDENIK